MTQLEITGKTINEAVDKACEQLGVGILDIEYKVIDEPSKGFLGIGAKPAKILVTLVSEANEAEEAKPEAKKPEVKKAERPVAKKPEAKKTEERKPEEKRAEKPVVAEPVAAETVAPEPTAYAEAVQDEAQSERANLTDEDKAAIVASAENFLSAIFAQMNMAVAVNTTFEDNKHIMIDLVGEDMGAVIGKRGQTLDSLQYLTNLVVNKGEYPYMNVTLDTEGYRAKRKKTLETLAFNLAKKAKHNRRNVTLEPMNPYERRIIHATLQNDRYVTTYSEGTEPYRYVVIALKNNYSSNRRSNY